MALGASIRNILGPSLRIGLAPVLSGVLVGTAAALLLSSLLKELLFDVSASDPMTFALAVIGMSGAGAAAALIPARRATRIQPAIALRAE
jgi:putative ABC transport system permease protein